MRLNTLYVLDSLEPGQGNHVLAQCFLGLRDLSDRHVQADQIQFLVKSANMVTKVSHLDLSKFYCSSFEGAWDAVLMDSMQSSVYLVFCL